MGNIEQRKNKDGTISYKVYWSLPKAMVPSGQKKATGSLTVYSLADAQAANDIAVAHKHAVSGDKVGALLVEQRAPASADGPMTLEQWFDIWIKSIGGDDKTSDRQVDTYRSQFKIKYGILDGLGKLPLADLEGHHLKIYFKDLVENRKISVATAGRYRSALRSCLYDAMRSPKTTGLLSNPAAGSAWKAKIKDRVAGEEERDPEKYFNGEKYSLILESIPPLYRLLVQFLAETGIRFSEATALKVNQINWETGQAQIYKAHKRSYSGKLLAPGSTKGGSERTVEITPTALAAVRSYVESHGLRGSDFIFRAKQGGRVHHSNFLRRYWKPMMRRLTWCPTHMPTDPESASSCTCLGDTSWTSFGPHALRHSWATWQILAGTPISFVSRQLGHPDTRFTERTYIHLVGREVLGMGMTLDKYLRPA